MKPRFDSALLVVLGLLLAVPAGALAQQPGGGSPVYTWVDAHGVRHYSDRPGAPDAVELTLGSLSTMPAPASSGPPGRPRAQPASAPASAPRPGTAARARRLAAYCAGMKRQIALLQSARRVQVKHADGSTEWLRGGQVVSYRKALETKVNSICGSGQSGS